jgi:bisphosphoglycerate-independent phosphoglycerate mutase (AlkP superfamily)
LRAAGLEYAVAVDSLSSEVWSGRVEQLDQQLTRLANAHSVKAVVTLLTADHQAAVRLSDDPDLAHAIDQAGIVAVAFTDEADAEALADALRQRVAAMGASPLGLKGSIRVVTNSL